MKKAFYASIAALLLTPMGAGLAMPGIHYYCNTPTGKVQDLQTSDIAEFPNPREVSTKVQCDRNMPKRGTFNMIVFNKDSKTYTVKGQNDGTTLQNQSIAQAQLGLANECCKTAGRVQKANAKDPGEDWTVANPQGSPTK